MARHIAFQTPVDPVTFAKYVKTIVPTFGKLDIASPTIIALAGLEALPQAVREQVRKHVDTKKKTKKDDAIHVVKVSDAVNCVNKTLRNPDALVSITTKVMAAITNVATNTDDALGAFADTINDCIRQKTLTQKNPRNVVRDTKHGRPAAGHGKARKR